MVYSLEEFVYLYSVNKLKFFLVTAAALFVFLGSVGFNVFTHWCDNDEVEISYFVQNDTHCEGSESTDENDCCNEEILDDCCHDELHHINLKLEYVNKVILTPILANHSTAYLSIDQIGFLTDVQSEKTSIDPPPRLCKAILLEKQSWLI